MCRRDEDEEDEPIDLSLETMEAQWSAYVQQMRESGQLSSAMAICDVSGSMNGEPMQVREQFIFSTMYSFYHDSSTERYCLLHLLPCHRASLQLTEMHV